MRLTAPLALTMGEPAGIGGEIALRAWLQRAGRRPFFMLDDPRRLRRIAEALRLPVPIRPIGEAAEAMAEFDTALPVLPLSVPVDAEPGRPEPRHAAMVLESITRAVALTQSGAAAAIVTNPIQKSVLYAAGFSHPGHTEFLAALTGAPQPVMLLAVPGLRVVPVTVHVPLARVPGLLSVERIQRIAHGVADGLVADFGIARPRLAFAGLNPHAGEDGALGLEDREIIAPALARLRAEGIDAIGPLPADTMFHAAARATYDVALCMYHDQALIPLKTLDFEHGVNITLGLPVVRTSPDHGTALDIAGKGQASPASLLAALDMAAQLANHRAAAQGREVAA